MKVRSFRVLKNSTLIALALIAVLIETGCVSVNIGGGKTEKSIGVAYTAPSAGFQIIKNERADLAWNNGSTGSTIAYQSTCGDTNDASLDSIAEDLFNGFEDSKDIRSERIPFDGREALRREIEGKVDGVVTQVQAIIYKKNNCSFILTFVTLSKSLVADNSRKAAINGDVSEFERFASSFKAP